MRLTPNSNIAAMMFTQRLIGYGKSIESKTIISQVESMNLEESLKNNIKSVIVFTPKIEILPPKGIPKTGLKAKRVIDERKRNEDE